MLSEQTGLEIWINTHTHTPVRIRHNNPPLCCVRDRETGGGVLTSLFPSFSVCVAAEVHTSLKHPEDMCVCVCLCVRVCWWVNACEIKVIMSQFPGFPRTAVNFNHASHKKYSFSLMKTLGLKNEEMFYMGGYKQLLSQWFLPPRSVV